jgi:hypothetical protein
VRLITLPNRVPLLPFGARLAGSRAGTIFLWQQDFGDHAPAPRRSSVPHVRSGELVWLRDREDRSEATSIPRGGDQLSASTTQLQLSECRSLSPASPFRALVTETAHTIGVEARALAVRALLHLPRLASYTGWVGRRQVQEEVRINAERLRSDVRAAMSYVPFGNFRLHDLAFEAIDPSRALPILSLLHYLKGARPDSLYFALVNPVDGLPVSLCSISPLQWKCVARQIRKLSTISPEQVWDVSRVFSVDGAPRNAISTLLSKVRTYLRHNRPKVGLLVTAIDLNLGFTGCSYRAANWQQWMTVQARPYFYEYGRYITPRQLRERFGTSSLVELQAKYPGRFELSKVKLLDSMIYCCSVNGKTKVVSARERRRLHR